MITLTTENLKRVTHFGNMLITLDEDGIFDLWAVDEIGELLYDNTRYSIMYSMLPSELFKVLSRNTKRVA